MQPPSPPPPPPPGGFDEGRGERAGQHPPPLGRVLPLRALSVADILDGAFRLLRSTFGRVAVLVLVLAGPIQLVIAFLTMRMLPEPFPIAFEPGQDVPMVDDATLASALGAGVVTGILGFLVHVLLSGAIIGLLLYEDAGLRGEPGQALRRALARAWPLLGGTALVGLLWAVIGFALAMVVGIMFVIVWPLAVLVAVPGGVLLVGLAGASTSIVAPIAMIETGTGPVAAAGRALSLVRARLGRMFGVTLLVMLVLVVVTFAISMLLGIASLLAGPGAWVVDGVTGTLTAIITTPVTALAALLLYVDARVRLEGWDLQLRARPPRPPPQSW